VAQPVDVLLLRMRMAQLRRRLRLAMVLRGAGRTAWVLAAVALADCALDRAFLLPGGARLALMAAGAAVVAWRLARDLVWPLLRPLPDAALALEVEGRWPGPPDLFAAALWLAEERGLGADALRRSVLARAGRAARGLSAGGLVQWRPVRRSLAAAGALLALAAGLAFAQPRAAALWAQRNLLLRNVPWPPRTRLAFVELPEVAPRGEPVRVSVHADGAVPRSGRLTLTGLQSATTRTLAMARTGGNRLEAESAGLEESVHVAVRAGDGRLDGRRIMVRERPHVTAARLVVRPPPYIAPEPVILPWNTPAFSVPVGSEATIVLDASAPLSDARCRADGAPAPAPEWDGEARVRFTLPVHADVHCAIALTDAFGLESAAPLVADITAVPDRAPQVRLAADGVGDLVLPTARLPLLVHVQDDYGAVGVRLEVTHEDGADAHSLPDMAVWQGPARAFVRERAVVDLSDLGLEPGGRLVIRAAARDACTVGGPNEGRSAPTTFRLVRGRELLAALLLRQLDLRRDLEDYLSEQRRLLRDVPAAGALARRQSALGGLLGLVGDAYADVLAQMLNNGILTDADHAARSAAVVAPLRRLAAPGGAVALAADALGRADTPAAAQAMGEIAAQLDAVRTRMLLMEGYASVLTSVEELAESQADLLRRTRAEQARALESLWDE